ncbi:MAG: biopolymer transporter ExbD [Syntrophales bacterium]|jgi:biopolymer transport protein ExbD|nr:biopolymer transporter ExbD [Syntrophales bacterium]
MEEKEFETINVIPFIDIMLVLLTIVLTTSTFIAQGAVPVELPRVTEQQPGTLRSVSIEIDRQCALYLNAKPVPLTRLGEEMKGISPETPILVRAHRDVALQVFVDVMDVVKNSGFKKLSLQTEVKR